MIYPHIMHNRSQPWVFRMPTQEDGLSIHELIAQCAPLDQNSAYCNFLQSSHFQHTCLIAEQQELLVGFVSAYRKPEKPNELFIGKWRCIRLHVGKAWHIRWSNICLGVVSYRISRFLKPLLPRKTKHLGGYFKSLIGSMESRVVSPLFWIRPVILKESMTRNTSIAFLLIYRTNQKDKNSRYGHF